MVYDVVFECDWCGNNYNIPWHLIAGTPIPPGWEALWEIGQLKIKCKDCHAGE